MNYLIKTFCFCFCLLPILFCQAQQTNERYPSVFGQFFRTLSFINPAIAEESGKMNFFFANQFYRAPFNQLNTSIGDVAYYLNKEEGRLRNGIGLSFISEKEGEVIGFTRAYFRYAIHVPVSIRWKLSAGVSAGFINFSANQTATSRPISSFAPDALIGIGFYSDKTKVGISTGQILNTKLKADIAYVTFPVYLNAFAQRKISLNRYFIVIPSVLGWIKNTDYFPINYKVNINGLVSNSILGGLGYDDFRGLCFHAGLNEVDFLSNPLCITFTYNTSFFSRSISGIESMELSLNYLIKKRLPQAPE